MKRAIYHRSKRVELRPAVQVTLAVLAVALLPTPVEMIARSDALFPVLAITIVAAITALAIFCWPVKR